MSTVAYAQLTTRREQATPGTSTSTSPPGVQSYVDALAALVPAEALTLHGLIISFTTEKLDDHGRAATIITAPRTLFWSFFGLICLSMLLYLSQRLSKWDYLDYVRLLIPPAALVAWMMVQRTTAFDAVWPELPSPARSVIALFLAVLLGFLAAKLATAADQKEPPH